MKLLLLAILQGFPALLGAADPAGEPRFDSFDEYRIILWTGDSAFEDRLKVPLFYRLLREMGANAGMVYDGSDPAPLVENKVPYSPSTTSSERRQ